MGNNNNNKNKKAEKGYLSRLTSSLKAPTPVSFDQSPNTLTTLYLLHKHLSKVLNFLLPRTYFDKHRSAFLQVFFFFFFLFSFFFFFCSPNYTLLAAFKSSFNFHNSLPLLFLFFFFLNFCFVSVSFILIFNLLTSVESFHNLFLVFQFRYLSFF